MEKKQAALPEVQKQVEVSEKTKQNLNALVGLIDASKLTKQERDAFYGVINDLHDELLEYYKLKDSK